MASFGPMLSRATLTMVASHGNKSQSLFPFSHQIGHRA
jgi:hypothetical protein